MKIYLYEHKSSKKSKWFNIIERVFIKIFSGTYHFRHGSLGVHYFAVYGVRPSGLTVFQHRTLLEGDETKTSRPTNNVGLNTSFITSRKRAILVSLAKKTRKGGV